MKIGAVPFLNAKPLVYGLEKIRFTQPSQLKKLFESSEIDVALLSSVELLRNPNYKFVDGIGISSNGPIDSVRLYFQRTPIRRLALDPSSLSGNCLAQIIVREKFGRPQTFFHSGSFPQDADGAVVIGDSSFNFSKLDFMDLSSEWLKLTGMPFVYALWLYKNEIDSEILHMAKRNGIANLSVIAREESCRLGMDMDFCLGYLKNINYDLGNAELDGLKEFRKLADKEIL